MEVCETELTGKEADQLSSVASCCNLEVAVTENKDENQLSIVDDSSSVEHLGLISQQEYEAQFFGFTPKAFSDGCKCSVKLVYHQQILMLLFSELCIMIDCCFGYYIFFSSVI